MALQRDSNKLKAPDAIAADAAAAASIAATTSASHSPPDLFEAWPKWPTHQQDDPLAQQRGGEQISTAHGISLNQGRRPSKAEATPGQPPSLAAKLHLEHLDLSETHEESYSYDITGNRIKYHRDSWTHKIRTGVTANRQLAWDIVWCFVLPIIIFLVLFSIDAEGRVYEVYPGRGGCSVATSSKRGDWIREIILEVLATSAALVGLISAALAVHHFQRQNGSCNINIKSLAPSPDVLRLYNAAKSAHQYLRLCLSLNIILFLARAFNIGLYISYFVAFSRPSPHPTPSLSAEGQVVAAQPQLDSISGLFRLADHDHELYQIAITLFIPAAAFLFLTWDYLCEWKAKLLEYFSRIQEEEDGEDMEEEIGDIDPLPFPLTTDVLREREFRKGRHKAHTSCKPCAVDIPPIANMGRAPGNLAKRPTSTAATSGNHIIDIGTGTIQGELAAQSHTDNERRDSNSTVNVSLATAVSMRSGLDHCEPVDDTERDSTGSPTDTLRPLSGYTACRLSYSSSWLPSAPVHSHTVPKILHGGKMMGQYLQLSRRTASFTSFVSSPSPVSEPETSPCNMPPVSNAVKFGQRQSASSITSMASIANKMKGPPLSAASMSETELEKAQILRSREAVEKFIRKAMDKSYSCENKCEINGDDIVIVDNASEGTTDSDSSIDARVAEGISPAVPLHSLPVTPLSLTLPPPLLVARNNSPPRTRNASLAPGTTRCFSRVGQPGSITTTFVKRNGSLHIPLNIPPSPSFGQYTAYPFPGVQDQYSHHRHGSGSSMSSSRKSSTPSLRGALAPALGHDRSMSLSEITKGLKNLDESLGLPVAIDQKQAPQIISASDKPNAIAAGTTIATTYTGSTNVHQKSRELESKAELGLSSVASGVPNAPECAISYNRVLRNLAKSKRRQHQRQGPYLASRRTIINKAVICSSSSQVCNGHSEGVSDSEDDADNEEDDDMHCDTETMGAISLEGLVCGESIRSQYSSEVYNTMTNTPKDDREMVQSVVLQALQMSGRNMSHVSIDHNDTERAQLRSIDQSTIEPLQPLSPLRNSDYGHCRSSSGAGCVSQTRQVRATGSDPNLQKAFPCFRLVPREGPRIRPGSDLYSDRDDQDGEALCDDSQRAKGASCASVSGSACVPQACCHHHNHRQKPPLYIEAWRKSAADVISTFLEVDPARPDSPMMPPRMGYSSKGSKTASEPINTGHIVGAAAKANTSRKNSSSSSSSCSHQPKSQVKKRLKNKVSSLAIAHRKQPSDCTEIYSASLDRMIALPRGTPPTSAATKTLGVSPHVSSVCEDSGNGPTKEDVEPLMSARALTIIGSLPPAPMAAPPTPPESR
ncbi:hypothetical protein BCR41DRAFT_383858 [Lobosporangium transversale]|uniref:Uncharacterized protein n=1 Tax=Lobosporangium transversale TaxID=64571 RepID=A0A1Y2H0A9_9FUNG|nr:hypothetical protein BCR41DRAFT_383858 [Lobosporangium transversale]ORZ27441.1 hypothetical protein BCR41DRAFT_383858 [Lobosporangium transversale]|eukprot:XP_021885168.1 hypothetical protein BCR41DRAFT_383858 [Lobosporangium transversale]